MTIARSFDKDIFISYCHTDNESVIGDGWIEVLHKLLWERLRQLYGSRSADDEPSIWRDDRLQGNDDFSQVLDDELSRVALLISVLSPSYVKSGWCQREIDNFCKAAQQHLGLQVGNHRMRMLKVIKTPIERELHPGPLQAATGYAFFTMDRERDRAREFTLTAGDENHSLMLTVLDDMAHSIIDTLQGINDAVALPVAPSAQGDAAKTAAAAAAIGGAPRAIAGMTVYLAEAHFEFDDDRLQLKRELSSHGLKVLPKDDLSLRNPALFRQQVTAGLSACDLAVHLVGSRRSVVLPDDEEDTVALQNRLAAERSAQAGLRRLVWLPEHRLQHPPEDDEQRVFLEQLRRDPATQQGAELLTLPLQGLIAGIFDQLDKVRVSRLPPERPAAPTASAGPASYAGAIGAAPPSVYLIWHPADAELVKSLRAGLFEQGLEVLEPLFEPGADEAAMASWHQSNLAECSAIMVCVGAADVNWWRAQSGDLRRAVGLRNGKPLAARGVYLGPPTAQFKAVLMMQGVTICNGLDGFAPGLLQGFAAQARQPILASPALA